MPNFRQIQQLRKAYSSNIQINNRLNERSIDVIEKSFSGSERSILENFQKNRLPSDIIEYLEREEEAHVVNIFIDITSFSTKASLMTNRQLSNYLDRYYSIVIPIIHKNGGEIEKIIGDGIIALFGQPFLKDDTNALIDKADRCSKEIITALEDTEWAVKVALHDGIIQYYKNKNIDGEYTMIGQPLTDLFRLESVSENNAINYYCLSNYDKNYGDNTNFCLINEMITYWEKSQKEKINLKGVGYDFKRSFNKVNSTTKYIYNYDFDNSIDRITQELRYGLNEDELSKRKTNIQPNIKEITEENSYIDITGMYLKIDIPNFKNEFEKLKIYKICFQEFLNIIRSNNSYKYHSIQNNQIFVVYNTPYKSQVDTVFSTSALIITFRKVINLLLNREGINSYPTISLALDYERTLLTIINQKEEIWTGNIFDKLSTISKGRINEINVTPIIYDNLNDDNKNLFHSLGKNYSTNGIYNVFTNNWLKDNQ